MLYRNQRGIAVVRLFQFQIKALSALARLRLLDVLFSTPCSHYPRCLQIILDLDWY